MKISFEDGSFISFLENPSDNTKLITVIMCGLKSDGKSLTMSSSELTREQSQEIIDFLTETLKKVE